MKESKILIPGRKVWNVGKFPACGASVWVLDVGNLIYFWQSVVMSLGVSPRINSPTDQHLKRPELSRHLTLDSTYNFQLISNLSVQNNSTFFFKSKSFDVFDTKSYRVCQKSRILLFLLSRILLFSRTIKIL